MNSALDVFKNNFARAIFGITRQDAHSQNLCIRCKAPVDSSEWEAIDLDEYQISGLCPTCFDEINKPI